MEDKKDKKLNNRVKAQARPMVDEEFGVDLPAIDEKNYELGEDFEYELGKDEEKDSKKEL